MKTYTCYTDGSCGPINPGGAMGFGFVILDQDDKTITEVAGGIPAAKTNSNNVAEYLALKSLLYMLPLYCETSAKIIIKTDSKLMYNQMNGSYAINDGTACFTIANECMDRLGQMGVDGWFIEMIWIKREQNSRADMLSNRIEKIVK